MIYEGKIREPLIEGEAIILRGQSFVIASFNIRAARDTAKARAVMRQVRDKVLADDSEEAIDAYTRVAAIALRANYPDVTDAWVADSLKMRELMIVINALTKANRDPEAGEAQAPAVTTGAEAA